MNTIDNLIKETQEKLNEWDKVKQETEITKYYTEKVEFLELQLKAYQELKNLGFNIQVRENEFCNPDIILNDILLITLNEYNNKGKYRIRVNYSPVSGYTRPKDQEPNNISIGKATKKKLDQWIEYAKEIIKKSQSVKEQIDSKRAESIAQIEKISNLPGVKFIDQSGNKDKSRGYFETENFYVRYEITPEGKLSTELNMDYGTRYSCIDLFEKLVLAGF